MEHDPERRQVLTVVRTVAGTPAASLLRNGDLLLEANGQTVNRFREVEKAFYAQDAIDLGVWRDGKALQPSGVPRPRVFTSPSLLSVRRRPVPACRRAAALWKLTARRSPIWMTLSRQLKTGQATQCALPFANGMKPPMLLP